MLYVSLLRWFYVVRHHPSAAAGNKVLNWYSFDYMKINPDYLMGMCLFSL